LLKRFQAVRLNKYLDSRRDLSIHRKGAKNAKVQFFLFSGERPDNKKIQLYKVNLIARATIFVTYVKLQLFSGKVLFFSLPSFLSAGILKDQRQRIRKNISATFASLR
jgi:hypothetical protein